MCRRPKVAAPAPPRSWLPWRLTLSIDLSSCQISCSYDKSLASRVRRGLRGRARGERTCSDWSTSGVGRPSSTRAASTTWPGWPTTTRWRRRRRASPVPRSCTSSHGAAKEPSRTGGSTRSSSAHRYPTPGRSSASASTTRATPRRAGWSCRRHPSRSPSSRVAWPDRRRTSRCPAPSSTTRPRSSWSSAGRAATFPRTPPGTWSRASPPARTSPTARCSSPARHRSSAWGRASAPTGRPGPPSSPSTPSRIPTTSRCAARCGARWSRSPRRRS